MLFVCTLALYFRVVDDYPLVIAANRDEHYDRASMEPHLWRTNPVILAGKDLLAGGTWLGVNQHGLMAGILNRRANGGAAGSSESRVSSPESDRNQFPVSSRESRVEPETRDLGPKNCSGTKPRPETGDTRRSENPQAVRPTRSRGLLCLDLLRLKSAAQGIEFVRSHDEPYQPFTLVFADPEQAWVVYTARQERKISNLSQGLHVFGNAWDFHLESEKASRAHGRFARVADTLRSNGTGTPDWRPAFATILGDHDLGDGSVDPKDAICVHADASGTVSSSIIVYSRSERQVETFFCPGPPCQASFGDALMLDIR
jgi:uncharacterized protein with NRDE domain